MEIGENDAHTNELNVHFENWIQNKTLLDSRLHLWHLLKVAAVLTTVVARREFANRQERRMFERRVQVRRRSPPPTSPLP